MRSIIQKQIDKELKYAQEKHGDEICTIQMSIKKAIDKLEKAEGHNNCPDQSGYSCCCGPLKVFCKCNENDRRICDSFAAIAILIRGIEKEFLTEGIMTERRNRFFGF